jgi:hypothetical protein
MAMRRGVRAIAVLSIFLSLGFVVTLLGQTGATIPVQAKRNSGQSVVPVFQGWQKGPDGTFYAVLGYYNRNFNQEVSVPVGPENGFDPGPVDQGQPGFFYTGLNRSTFRIQLPKDWGRKELTWTLVANGHTEKAVVSLLPEWEIDPSTDLGGGASAENQPPSLDVARPAGATVGSPLTLSATVKDDGNPPSAAGRGGARGGGRGGAPAGGPTNQGKDAFPTLHKGERGVSNVPFPLSPMPQPQGAGLTVGYVTWRGPSRVTVSPQFQQAKERTGGTVTATASFDQPGQYVLRAVATDGRLRVFQMVPITVAGAAPGR